MVVFSCYNSGTGTCRRTKIIITNGQTPLLNTERTINRSSALGGPEVAASSQAGAGIVTRRRYIEEAMSYNLTLRCGCLVYVACDPRTTVAHARILERRDPGCRVRKHEVGLRLSLREIVPALGEIVTDPEHRPVPRREAREIVMRAALGLRRETN
jgi:hypothetical protein